MWHSAQLLLPVMAGLYVQGDDYLGVKFDPSTHPLCRTYGCAHVQRAEFPGSSGSSASFFLRSQAAKVELSLSPYATVWGLELWTQGPYDPTSRRGQLIREITAKSALQNFKPELYAKCFNSVKPLPNSSIKQAEILTGWHYYVECLEKTVAKKVFVGIRVRFDY